MKKLALLALFIPLAALGQVSNHDPFALPKTGGTVTGSLQVSNGIDKLPRANVLHTDFAGGADVKGINSSSAAITAAIVFASSNPQGGNPPVVYVQAGKYKITSTITISSSVSIICDKGAVFKKAFNGDVITITASNVTIEGCSIDGQRASGFTGRGVVVNTVDSVTIKGGDYSHNASSAIYAPNVTNFKVDGITASDNQGNAVMTDTTVAGSYGPIVIQNSTLDASLCTANFCHAFTAHTVTTGATTNGVTLQGNTLYTNTGFCGEFFGLGSQNGNYINNKCYAQGAGTAPHAFSFDNVQSGSMSNNIVWVKQSTTSGTGFMLELADNSNDVTVANNTVVAAPGASFGDGIHVDLSNNNKVSNNFILGFNSHCIIVGATRTVPFTSSASNNEIETNKCYAQNTTGSLYGIFMQDNLAAGTVNNNYIHHNRIFGATATASFCFHLENDNGAMDGTRLEANYCSGMGLYINAGQDTNTVSLNPNANGIPSGGTHGAGFLNSDPFGAKVNYQWTSDTVDPNVCLLNTFNAGSDSQGGFVSCNSFWNGSAWVKASMNASNNALFLKTAPTQFAVEFGPVNSSRGNIPGTSAIVATKTSTQFNTPTVFGTINLAPVATPGAMTLTTATTGGTLADSTSFCYREAATNANGTTQANTEQCITTGNSGSNTNTITIVPALTIGATGYTIYGRTTGNGLLLTPTPIDPQVATFTDDGSVTPSGALPIANTTLGTYKVNGTAISAFTGTTASIGGSALTAGQCTSGTVTITGSTTSMVASTSPAIDPGTGFTWNAFISSSNTATVRVCALIAGTPTASTYNVRVN